MKQPLSESWRLLLLVSVLSVSAELLRYQLVAADEPVAQSPNILQRLSTSVRNAMSPISEPVRLMDRYARWMLKWQQLANRSEAPMKSAGKVIREEYAKLDEFMVQEACLVGVELTDDLEEFEVDPVKVENIEFVYKLLQSLIDRLEERLLEEEQRETWLLDGPADDVAGGGANALAPTSEQEQKELEALEEKERIAMDRLRRTAINSAKRMAAKEVKFLAEAALMHTLLTVLKQHSMTADGFNYLQPFESIVMMLGGSTASLATIYKGNVEFRLVTTIFAKPMAALRCELSRLVNFGKTDDEMKQESRREKERMPVKRRQTI